MDPVRAICTPVTYRVVDSMIATTWVLLPASVTGRYLFSLADPRNTVAA